MSNRGLGKGFGSLLPEDFDQSMLLDKHDRIQKISVEEVAVDPNQPRSTFDETQLNELASSIKRHGILQPLVVTGQSGSYQIVAGERRYRAAKKAGLKTVPVLVRSLEELERLEIGLVENVQRVDLNPMEQAISIVRLHEQFNIGYEEIAQRLGKANTTIINIARLVQLPDFAREALSKGTISEGHARSILAVKTEEGQRELLNNIEQFGWSVRRAEQFAADTKQAQSRKTATKIKRRNQRDETRSKELSTKWGFKVSVTEKGKGGRIALDFKTQEQLHTFVALLEREAPKQ